MRPPATATRLADMGALELATAAREILGAKLVHLRDRYGEIGREPEPGLVWTWYVRPEDRRRPASPASDGAQP